MHLDVQDLKSFYYRSQLGRATQTVLRNHLTHFWPEAHGQTVAGFGFAAPLLRPYLGDARRVLCLMPGPQGVMPWPGGQENVSVLCEEIHWPIQTGQIDKLVLLHGLETCEQPSALLDECFRCLGPGGRAIFVVPNRAGLWSRSDRTPFGYGRPYSLGQLEAQLKRHSFAIEHSVSALYQPPTERKFWRKTAWFWEGAGQRIPILAAGGILMVEVSKQVYAPRKPGLPAAVSRPLEALDGLTSPSPKPASRQ
ncbi:methyltransferase domain-containing protein [Pseudaestuariivita rosea]|uniref:methyltransferase domain-containing protein n=1 Tax=Pseudaestuariivita rosea TaxID=2763263 RepID=UPI001ABBD2E1|nr:methyltransferase domain-containing protein [Pseudaestuariivita rosea]